VTRGPRLHAPICFRPRPLHGVEATRHQRTLWIFHAGLGLPAGSSRTLALTICPAVGRASQAHTRDEFPIFETSGMVLLKRLTLVILDGTVEHVFYPVFPPHRSASKMIEWLSERTVLTRWQGP